MAVAFALLYRRRQLLFLFQQMAQLGPTAIHLAVAVVDDADDAALGSKVTARQTVTQNLYSQSTAGLFFFANHVRETKQSSVIVSGLSTDVINDIERPYLVLTVMFEEG